MKATVTNWRAEAAAARRARAARAPQRAAALRISLEGYYIVAEIRRLDGSWTGQHRRVGIVEQGANGHWFGFTLDRESWATPCQGEDLARETGEATALAAAVRLMERA